jgi:hypothetical protein
MVANEADAKKEAERAMNPARPRRVKQTTAMLYSMRPDGFDPAMRVCAYPAIKGAGRVAHVAPRSGKRRRRARATGETASEIAAISVG